jgi:hypothetical protein
VAVAGEAAVVDTARRARDASDGWRPLVVVDEVSVAIETQTLERTVLGARVTALLRWDYRARAASPTAWDAGARAAFGVMQFDCGNRALRTRSWTPVDARGERVEALVVRTDASADAEEWVRPRAASMGGRILAAVCRAPEAETASR